METILELLTPDQVDAITSVYGSVAAFASQAVADVELFLTTYIVEDIFW